MGTDNVKKIQEANKQLQDKTNYLSIVGRNPPVGLYQTSTSRDIADLKDAIGLFCQIGLLKNTVPDPNRTLGTVAKEESKSPFSAPQTVGNHGRRSEDESKYAEDSSPRGRIIDFGDMLTPNTKAVKADEDMRSFLVNNIQYVPLNIGQTQEQRRTQLETIPPNRLRELYTQTRQAMSRGGVDEVISPPRESGGGGSSGQEAPYSMGRFMASVSKRLEKLR